MTASSGDGPPQRETITPSAGLVGNVAGQRLLLLLASADHPLGQIVRFGIMTAMSASVTLGLPILLHEAFGLIPQYAAAIAFVVAFLLNFVSLRRLVFRSSRGAARDFITFTLSSVAFRATEYVAFLGLTLLVHMHYVIALLLVLTSSAMAKFLWYRRVLHDRSDVNASEPAM
jgi:putative flippase GtrA